MDHHHGIYNHDTHTLHRWFGGQWCGTAVPGDTPVAVVNTALGATDVHDVWVRGVPREWWDTERSGPSGGINFYAITQNKDRAHAIRAHSPALGRCFLHEWGAGSWPGETHPDPPLVMRAYDAVSARLGRAFGFSPASLGLSILEESRRKRPEWFAPERLDVTIKHPRQDYVRPIRPDEPPYAHWYDMRAAHLGVARSLRFPTGPAMHIADPRLLFGAVGLGTAEHAALADLTYDRTKPGPMRRDGWHAQSIYRAALAAGQRPVIHDTYVYPQRHDALREWAETIAAAAPLIKADLAGDVAAQRIAGAVWKTCYVMTIGRLASKPERGAVPWYHLPMWHAMIEGEALRRAWLAVAPDGARPALCLLTDGVMLASDDPDPDAAIVPLGTAPGQFVYKWTTEGYSLDARAAALAGDATLFRDTMKEHAR